MASLVIMSIGGLVVSLKLNSLTLKITFPISDFKGIYQNSHYLIVIIVIVEYYIVKKVLVDQGSFIDILFLSIF